MPYNKCIIIMYMGLCKNISVAKNLIENPANIEKGLCQRFLWLVPKPTPVSFQELQQVKEEFSTSLGKIKVYLVV